MSTEEFRSEEEWRAEMWEQGCTCPCQRVYGYDRIVAAGGDPANPHCVVFHHTEECAWTAAHAVEIQWRRAMARGVPVAHLN